MAWKTIAEPPEKQPHPNEFASVRVLGILANGHHVFAQYTPWYEQDGKDANMIWTCEGFSAATKPVYWQALEPLPQS